jgi:hypothetical protein
LNDSSLLGNDVYGEREFTDLRHKVFRECGVLLLLALHVSERSLQNILLEPHRLEIFLRHDTEEWLNGVTQEGQVLCRERLPKSLILTLCELRLCLHNGDRTHRECGNLSTEGGNLLLRNTGVAK